MKYSNDFKARSNFLIPWGALVIFALIASFLLSEKGQEIVKNVKAKFYVYDCVNNKNVKSCYKLSNLGNKVVLKYLDRKDFFVFQDIICQSEDFKKCVNFAKHFLNKNIRKDLARKNFKFACRDGAGGNMEACGLFSKILEQEGNVLKAKELRDYSCKNGFKQFCKN